MSRRSAIEPADALKVTMAKVRTLASGQIARASIVSMTITLVGLALGFAQAVLTARLLGAASYGMVAVPMAVVQIVALLALSGYGGLAVREVPARIAEGNRVGVSSFVRNALLVVLALSATASALVIAVALASGLVSPSYRLTLAIGGLLVVPAAVTGLFRGVAQGFGRILQAQAPGELVRPAAMVAAMGCIALFGAGLGAADYMWLSLATTVLPMLVAGVWLWRSEAETFRQTPATDESSRRLLDALPFLGLGLTDVLQAQANTLLLGWLASAEQAGLFQPIVRLAPVLMVPLVAAGMRFGPRIAELWQSGQHNEIRRVARMFTWTTSLLTAAIGLAVAAGGTSLMSIFGSEFRQVAPLLWIIAGAQMFNAATGPVGWLLAMRGRTASVLGGRMAGLITNIVLGLVLIPTQGALGATIALAAGIVVCNATTLFIAIAECGFDPSLASFLWRRRAAY